MRQVEKLLVIGIGVNCSHESAFDSERFMKNFGNRCETVCRARRVGNDGVFRGIISLVVDAETNRDVFTFSRGRDDHFFHRAAQMFARVLGIREQTRGFHDYGYVHGWPLDLCRIFFFEDLDAFAIDFDVVFAVADIRLKVAQHGVIFKKMRQRLRIRDVVHRHNIDILVVHRGTVKIASNAPKTVDTYPDCHYVAPHDFGIRNPKYTLRTICISCTRLLSQSVYC